MAHTTAFRNFSRIILERAGLHIDKDKLYLLETRLSSLCREEGVKDITELNNKLQGRIDEDKIRRIVESMTTNETWWFRDPQMFECLKNQIWPGIIRGQKGDVFKEVRMWSLPCSTGQEPYSLRLAWEDMGAQKQQGFRLKITGSDIDTQALERAKAGKYTQLEVGRGLPAMNLITSFDQVEDRWVLKSEYKRDITWQQANIMNPPLRRNFYDIVLCRNVLIYFNDEGKKKALGYIAQALKPTGILIVGGSESLYTMEHAFERVAIGRIFAYCKPEGVSFVKEHLT